MLRNFSGTRSTILALACALSTTALVAQQRQEQQAPTPAQQTAMDPGVMNNQMAHSQQDAMFLKAASQGSNYEIKAGKLAEKNSTSPDVQAFGKMMTKDHMKLNEAMMPIATDMSTTVPTDLSDEDKAEYDKLKMLKGQAFDQEYISVMLAGHKKALAAFQQEIAQGQLAPEKQAAQKGEPIVQMHLDKIQQIAQAHNVSASGM